MNGLLQIIFIALAFVTCLWFALFVLSWRNARQRLEAADDPEPVEHPMPQARPIHYFTILPLYWFIFFLIWPAFVGNRLGRPRGGR